MIAFFFFTFFKSPFLPLICIIYQLCFTAISHIFTHIIYYFDKIGLASMMNLQAVTAFVIRLFRIISYFCFCK